MNNWFTFASPRGPVLQNRWAQAGLIIGLWMLMDRMTSYFHIPLPGSVVGLLLLWFVLDAGLLKSAWLERGADSLMEHLMLFFVPAMLSLVDHRELFSLLGLKLLAAVLVGTLLVMASTALVMEFGLRWMNARAAATK